MLRYSTIHCLSVDEILQRAFQAVFFFFFFFFWVRKSVELKFCLSFKNTMLFEFKNIFTARLAKRTGQNIYPPPLPPT